MLLGCGFVFLHRLATRPIDDRDSRPPSQFNIHSDLLTAAYTQVSHRPRVRRLLAWDNGLPPCTPACNHDHQAGDIMEIGQ